MSKLLNITFLLLVLGLSCFLSCKGQPDLKQLGIIEPTETEGVDEGINKGINWDNEQSSISYIPERTTFSPPDQMQMRSSVTSTAPTSTDMISVSGSGSYVISRTYPWPECGVVQLEKTMPREVELNKEFEYFITVTNLTNSTLTDVVVDEDVPDNFRLSRSSPVADEESETKLVWTIDSLGPKGSRRLVVSGMATYGDSIKQNTTILTPVIPASANMKVVQPMLKLTKVVPSEALLCDTIPVKLVVSNIGTGAVQNVRIVDTLPVGLRTTDGRNEIVINVGTLMTNQSQEFSVELKASRIGKYVSKAVATSGSGLRAESAAVTTSVGMPVLTIKKTGPERQYLGRPVTYEITITNKSDVAARNTIVEDTVPDGVNSVKATAGAKLTGSKLVWEFGTLEPNASQKVLVSYTPTRAGTFINDATATAYCASPVTDSMRTVVAGIPALLLDVSDVEDPIRIGSQATYVIKVTNQGSANATNIRITCVLEDYVQYVSSAGATSGVREGDTLRFLPLASLAPQDKAAWRVVVTAARPGDVLFKVIMSSEQLTRPVEETEATHLYE